MKNYILICVREDNYCIDDLVMINHPKIDEIVKVERVVVDEDGTWLYLMGYPVYMYDANCFRELTLEDVNKLNEVGKAVTK